MVVRNVTAMALYDLSFVYTNDDFKAGILVSTECIIGCIMLLGVIIGSHRISALKSPFGKLMINQNSAQLMACVNSGSFFLFGVALNIKLVLSQSYLFGNLSVYLLPVILGSFFLMSLNRFCAAVFPFGYSKIFSPRKIPYLIMLNWIIPLISSVWVFIIRDCKFVFYHFGWIFTEQVRNANCGALVVTYAMYVQLTLSATILLLDLATLAVLVCLRGKVYQSHSQEMRRREINFAIQVLLQGLIFVMHGFWYDMGYKWVPGDSEQWKIFFTTSFSSNLLHVFDPMVVFVFNTEFRHWLFHKKKKPVVRKVTRISSAGTKI